VAPVGDSPATQELVVLEKTTGGEIRRRAVAPVMFVPMVFSVRPEENKCPCEVREKAMKLTTPPSPGRAYTTDEKARMLAEAA
jgi:hypothetical protein